MGTEELGRLLGRDPCTIMLHARKLGIKKINRKYYFTKEEAEKIKNSFPKKKKVLMTTFEVSKYLERSVTQIQIHAKRIGIVFAKRVAHDYTAEEVEKIRLLLPAKRTTKEQRKEAAEVITNPWVNKDWWIDPLPKCLQDDYEGEEWNV